MAQTVDLGNVKGNKGDTGSTYIPQLVINDNEIKINWLLDGELIEGQSLTIPFYYPEIINRDGKNILHFTRANSGGSVAAEIDLADLKGDPGSLKFIFLDTLPSIGEENTLYIINEDDETTEEDDVGSVFIYNPYTTKEDEKWVKLESLSILSGYVKIEDFNEAVSNINNTIDSRMGIVEEQQYTINKLLGKIIADEEVAAPSDITIQVISDEQVESLKQEIYNDLRKYIKVTLVDGDLQFTADDNYD